MESPFDNPANKTIALYLEPMLNSYYKSYQDIITLSDMPAGPLQQMVAKINAPKLSEFQTLSAFSPPPISRSSYSTTCLLALCRYPTSQAHPTSKTGDYFMYASDVPNVYGYLESNGYRILDSLTTMTYRGPVDIATSQPNGFHGRRRLICMFRYIG
jgi:hypothetical protein